MTVSKALLIALASLLFSSCIPYRTINIQYYDKPPQGLPVDSGGRVVLLANLYSRHLPTKKAMMDWALDSVAATEATAALEELLLASPAYEGLTPAGEVYYRTDTSTVILPLSWEQLADISARNGRAEVVVSLDYIRVNPYTDNIPRWEGGIKSYYGYLDMAVYAYWRVYDLRSRKVVSSFLHRDTLSWEATDWVEVRAGRQLPGFFAASAYAGADAAEKYARQVAPSWGSDTRIVFNGKGKPFLQATALAEKGSWIDAAALWQRYTDGKNSSVAAMAAFNMALANEMLGNFEVALEWLSRAHKLNPNLREVEEYRAVILSRVEANR